MTVSRGTDAAGIRTRWSGRAPAKTNLFLHVLEREASGYHGIETLFQALDLADELSISFESPAEGMSSGSLLSVAGRTIELVVEGERAEGIGPPSRNLVIRAVEVFVGGGGELPPGDLRIRLTKRIPHGAGLGGGSSDAAATLRGLNELATVPVEPDRMVAMAGKLGSDVPFFLSGSSLALGWGRGLRLLPLPPLPVRPVLLVVPDFGISTPYAYSALAAARNEGRDLPGARCLDPDALASWDGVARLAANDFHAPMEAEQPRLAWIRTRLLDLGAGIALLSGSGSSVVGIFEGNDARDRARQALASEPDLRLVSTHTAG